MNVRELKCTSCFAPIDLTKVAVAAMRCPYCGAALAIENDAPPPVQTRPLIDAAKYANMDTSKALSLTLLDCGASKISVIAAIREVTRLGLKDSKDLAEAAPCVVLKSHDWSKVNSLEIALRDAGATTKKEAVDD